MTRGWVTRPVGSAGRAAPLELGFADPVPLSDTHLVVGQAVDGEVLAELAEAEIGWSEVLLPVLIGLDPVDQHGPLLAAVTVGVAGGGAVMQISHAITTKHHLDGQMAG
ncbi:hypothetical protein GCM10009608_46690 [Pseudonocardia alaniniphila]